MYLNFEYIYYCQNRGGGKCAVIRLSAYSSTHHKGTVITGINQIFHHMTETSKTWSVFILFNPELDQSLYKALIIDSYHWNIPCGLSIYFKNTISVEDYCLVKQGLNFTVCSCFLALCAHSKSIFIMNSTTIPYQFSVILYSQAV